MPTVYAVMGDVDTYQRLAVTKWRQFDDRFPINGTPIRNDWEPPEVYIENPLRQEPNIWAFSGTAYAFENSALELVQAIVEPLGELLPLLFEERELTVLNVTYVEDCFDREKGVTDEEFPEMIEEYAFDLSKLKHSLFLIPETVRGYLYAVEGVWEPEREFKATVEKHKLTGISFRELWTDEG